MKPPISISMSFVRAMLSCVESRGLQVDSLLRDAGIDVDLLHEVSARVTGEQYATLFALLVIRLDDDGLAFFSRPLPRGSFVLIVRAALGAPSLERAMKRMARTFRLLQDDVELVTVREGQLAGWELRFKKKEGPRPNFIHELLLRIFWLTLAWLVGGRLDSARFDLEFERPEYANSYRMVLPGELRFSQPQSALWFEAHALTAPIRRDEAALRTYIANIQWNIMLPPSRNEDVSTRVRLHLQDTVPTWPDRTATSQALHMSVSKLQRHLVAEQTNFQALKDELRRDMAINRMTTSNVSLVALATELGFSDSAAFQRAFKVWTGSAPGAYRRRSN